MNLSDEIRKQIEKNKGLKLAVGEINNHLSILEGLVRKDIMEQVDDAYQRGLAEGKKAFDLLDAERDSEYQRGLSEGNDIGYKDGVKDGQNEAWECAKKLFSTMSETKIEKVFPTEWNNGGFNALINLQPQEAIAKLKAYEEKQNAEDKIKVGDEVIYNGTTKCVIVTPETDEKYASLFDCNGIHYFADHRECKKTGRHFDIASILEDMRHD